MLIVTDIEWDMEGWEGTPLDYGLPDEVAIEELDCTQPIEMLRCDIQEYLEGLYGFWAIDFCVEIED